MLLAAAAAAPDHSGILCTILLIATIIALIVGLAELIGLGFVGNRLGANRYSPLVVGVILLIIYVVLC